jgi:serine/threonine-protein kinase
MGAVYQGIQLRLNKRVAIKVLARELSANEEALARFRREAEVTSQLGHPHIVQVNDFGTTPSGEPYLVMEFLEGEDLDQRIRKARRLSLPTTANVVKQIASALSSTHARGIVHRDLKPANVFLMEVEGEAEFVKIVDFGISKVRAASLRLTSAYAVMGTPNYMSPEQASGQVEDVDHRTDQWSLACIAYEMLAGRGPFLGDTIHSLLYQVVNQQPPQLTSLVPGLPPEVEKVVARGMAKAKADRFPTINAFSRAFAAAATTSPGSLAVGTSPTEATVSTARVRQEVPAPRPPEPQPTTLSRTASELVTTPISRLRAGLKSKWTAVAGGAVAIAVVALVVYPKSPRPNQVDVEVRPASPGSATSSSAARAPVIAPLPAAPVPPVPAVVPVPPPPAPSAAPVATPPSIAQPPLGPGSAANDGGKPKHSRTKAPVTTTAAPPTAVPATKVPPNRPPARRGAIIEEL